MKNGRTHREKAGKREEDTDLEIMFRVYTGVERTSNSGPRSRTVADPDALTWRPPLHGHDPRSLPQAQNATISN